MKITPFLSQPLRPSFQLYQPCTCLFIKCWPCLPFPAVLGPPWPDRASSNWPGQLSAGEKLPLRKRTNHQRLALGSGKDTGTNSFPAAAVALPSMRPGSRDQQLPRCPGLCWLQPPAESRVTPGFVSPPLSPRSPSAHGVTVQIPAPRCPGRKQHPVWAGPAAWQPATTRPAEGFSWQFCLGGS